MSFGGEIDDAYIGARLVGCSLECGHEQFGDLDMVHVVDAELDFLAFCCVAAWDGHYAGIVHEDVETLGFGCELADSCGDGLERGQIKSNLGNVC